jgi:hypothetical protein
MAPSALVVVSDQLITDGSNDEQHEAPQLKVLHLGSRISSYLSGNLDLGQQVCRRAIFPFAFEPQTVETAARLVCDHANTLVVEQFERRLVRRYKTTLDDLLAGRSALAPEVSSRLIRKYDRANLDADFLIVGVDMSGAHAWVISGTDDPSCHDPWSFAAIGSGYKHARRRLKRMGYQWSWMLGDALMAAYLAKRDAEIDAWVGSERTSVIVLTHGASYELTKEEKLPLEEAATTYAGAVTFAELVARSGGGQKAVDALRSRRNNPMPPPRPDPEAGPPPPPESTHGP